MTTTKKLIATVASVLALLASANAANARDGGSQSESRVFDSCMAHDWARFTAAVAANDYVTLDQMARDPELRACPIVDTARVLACGGDPMLCIEPAAGPNTPEVEQDTPPHVDCAVNCDWDDDEPNSAVGPFPGQRPGQPLGMEQNRNDFSDRSTPSGGGSAPSAGPGAGTAPRA